MVMAAASFFQNNVRQAPRQFPKPVTGPAREEAERAWLFASWQKRRQAVPSDRSGLGLHMLDKCKAIVKRLELNTERFRSEGVSLPHMAHVAIWF
jgi:hypothetical protein